MQIAPAAWSDVLDALELEARSLGEGVAWDVERARSWWESGAETAFCASDDEGMIGFACAMHLSPAAFDAIVSGELSPEELDLQHIQRESGCYWVGIVVVEERARGRGVGRGLMESVMSALDGGFVADVYTEAGLALLLRLGWRVALDGPHPVCTWRSS